MTENNAWTYELLVKDIYDTLLKQEGIEVSHRRQFTGKRTGQSYEIDLSFEFEKAGVRFVVLVECKCYTRSVGVDDAVEFAYKIDDIGAHKGILVTTHGFQKGVFTVAEAAGVALVKIFRPGEFDVNIADCGSPDYDAEYFLDYPEYSYSEKQMPSFGFGLQSVLLNIFETKSTPPGERFSRIAGAEEEARSIAAEADATEEAALVRQLGSSPEGLIARFNLARHYHRVGRYDEAIGTYLRLLADGVSLPKLRDFAGGNLDTPEVIFYNLACTFSLKGDSNLALAWLRRVKEHRGTKYLSYAHVDSDFDPIRDLPEFKEITTV